MIRRLVMSIILTVASLGCQSNSGGDNKKDRDANPAKNGQGVNNDLNDVSLASESEPVVLAEGSTVKGKLTVVSATLFGNIPNNTDGLEMNILAEDDLDADGIRINVLCAGGCEGLKSGTDMEFWTEQKGKFPDSGYVANARIGRMTDLEPRNLNGTLSILRVPSSVPGDGVLIKFDIRDGTTIAKGSALGFPKNPFED